MSAWAKLSSWARASIRRFLLVLLLPGLGIMFTTELWLTWRTSSEAADAAYDRSLLGAVKSIDANISTASGGLGVELPYSMLEFFEITAQSQVYYRIATEDGLVEIGSADLPAPARPLRTGEAQFHEADYRGQAVRIGSYARELNPPLAEPMGQAKSSHPQRVVIQVAETLEARHEFRRALVWQSVMRDLLLMTTACALLVLVITWAMRPLRQLRQEVQGRDPQDLTPMDPKGAPAEVMPLVQAINHHIARNHEQAQARRRFIDDASHQLRTPLTTLLTQVAYAQRESDPRTQRQALDNIRQQLDETIRQTNQMLSLARADSAPLQRKNFDILPLAEELIRQWWSPAREQGIDLGLEAPPQPVHVLGEPDLLREALTNLVHNAIRHGGAGCHVTLLVHTLQNQRTVQISVVDDGPGLAPQDMARAGERFFRGPGAVAGSGLGLSIVRTIAQRHGGHMQVSSGFQQRGLKVTLSLPLSTPMTP